jgi:hypothetical protein
LFEESEFFTAVAANYMLVQMAIMYLFMYYAKIGIGHNWQAWLWSYIYFTNCSYKHEQKATLWGRLVEW